MLGPYCVKKELSRITAYQCIYCIYLYMATISCHNPSKTQACQLRLSLACLLERSNDEIFHVSWKMVWSVQNCANLYHWWTFQSFNLFTLYNNIYINIYIVFFNGTYLHIRAGWENWLPGPQLLLSCWLPRKELLSSRRWASDVRIFSQRNGIRYSFGWASAKSLVSMC